MIEIIIFATLCLTISIITVVIFTRIIRNILGADNEYCGFMNIDCGKSGYKTNREIELEKKLEIVVKALKFYAERKTWEPCHKIQCAYVDGYTAQQALKEIEGWSNLD